MKQKKPMRRIGRNLARLNAIYYKRAREYIEENPLCVIKSPVCTRRAQAPQHARGRGKYLLEEKYWFPACNLCNCYLKNNYKWGEDRGFNLDRIGIIHD